MVQRPAGSGLVYSTDGGGRMCPRCRQAVAACTCAAAAAAAAVPAPGKVRLTLESKGRGGKAVTLVRGLPLPPDELQRLAQALRGACGCGGTLKDGVVELQGDQRGPATAFLAQRGLAPQGG
ncbi:MAG: stress response translation initiation inhibitor YciH [Rhodoferax sp.]|jgi:translation initiation factor 1|nr:stress response translation initiation inhibitor YciH [Rhodoferax sp.]